MNNNNSSNHNYEFLVIILKVKSLQLFVECISQGGKHVGRSVSLFFLKEDGRLEILFYVEA